MKGKSLSPAVVLAISSSDKGKEKAKEPAEDMGDEDAGLSSLGKALCEAVEKKDYAAIGRALKDAHEYCQPEPAGEDE